MYITVLTGSECILAHFRGCSYRVGLQHFKNTTGFFSFINSCRIFLYSVFYILSTKRKQQLRQDLGFCDLEISKVLKHVPTRWLSLSRCLERALKQWDGLRTYFMSNFYDDNK